MGTISVLTEAHVRMTPACVLRDLKEITANTAPVSVYYTQSNVKSMSID